MERLIDAMQTTIKLSRRITPLIEMGENPMRVYQEVLQVIAESPTVDAVEVVQGLWIPVTERLPGNEDTYLVYTERGSVYASHFYTEKRFASGYVREAQWSQRGTVKVTHWMPLPLPPEFVKEDL